MFFIELFGSTNSGKSFFLSRIKLNLSRKFPLVLTAQDVYNYFLFRSKYNLINFLFSLLPLKLKSFLSFFFFVRVGYIKKYKELFYKENQKFTSSFQKCLDSIDHTKEHRINCIEWFDSAAMLFQFCKKNLPKSTVVVLDEGFTQKLFNTLVSSKKSVEYELVSPYMNSLPDVNSLIYIDSSIGSCLSRSNPANLPLRIRNSNAEEIKKFISSSVDLSRFIYTYFNKLPIIKIKNN